MALALLAEVVVAVAVEAAVIERRLRRHASPSSAALVSCEIAASSALFLSALPEAAAPPQPKTASEVDLDGLNEDELHWLQKRIEQKQFIQIMLHFILTRLTRLSIQLVK